MFVSRDVHNSCQPIVISICFVSRDTHNSRQSIVIPVCLSAVIHIKLLVKSYIITFVSRGSHRICELIAIHVINRLCLLVLRW